MSPRRAVFLDRDGVLTEALLVDGRAMSPTTLTDLRLSADAQPAIERLRAAGWLLLVVTNQPDIAKGTLSLATVEAMHKLLREALRVDAVYHCPHDAAAGCSCRKPSGGMLRDAAVEHDVDLARSWMVGDRWVDIAAGVEAGARTILLERPYSWLSTSSGAPPDGLRPDATVADLSAAAEVIIAADRDGATS